MNDERAGRTLHLIRHAKSSWDDPALADRDRPLNSRGRRAGVAMAGYLRDHGVAPDLVLCSPAVRARQTLELIAAGFSGDEPPRVELEPRIYEATGTGLLAILRDVPDGVVAAMLVGHQPAIQELARTLADSPSDRARLGGKFPTAALATFGVPGAWAGVGAGAAGLLDYVKPRELEGR